MNTTEKLIEVKFKKKVFNTTKAIEKVMLFITVAALVFLIESFVEMVEQWSISGIPFIISIVCLAWLGIFTVYLLTINR